MNKKIIIVELYMILAELDIVGKITLQVFKMAVIIFNNSREAFNILGQLNVYTGTLYLRNLIYRKLSD